MGRIYNFLGMSVGVIVHGIDDDQRKAAYAADITYAPTTSTASTISATT